MQTYMPLIGNGPQEPVVGQSNDEFIYRLFFLMGSDSRQKHPLLTPNDKLAAAAQAHARNMATNNYFSHVAPGNIWPNQRVRAAGYHLPDDWPDDANYVESICAGQPNAEEAWNAWMHSPSHSKHLLGLSDFFAAQTNVGIGYAFKSNSTYQHYWCVVTAPPE